MNDFKHLLKEAHRRNIHVIIDLVLNHTSNQHPFFKSASNDPNSSYHDWYIWSDTSRGRKWYQAGNSYYYALFCGCMPDLNYNNPEVTAQMENVTDFWLNDIGVDGFRVDAAKHLIEDGDKIENTPATHEWYKGFYKVYKQQKPQAYTVGEVYGAGSSVVKSYTGDQLDQVFNFEMASGFVNSANGGANSGILSAMKFAEQDMPDFNFATFLTNHDQNRAISVFYGNVDKAKAASFLMLTSPGTPYIYYGEEIGMQGQKPDEDIRLPMQWNADQFAGFSISEPWRLPASDYAQVNVGLQTGEPDSLLEHYRALIALRKQHPALSGGQISLVETHNTGIYSALRMSKDETLLVLVNLTGQPITDYSLKFDKNVLGDHDQKAVMLFGADQAADLAGSALSSYQPFVTLAPYGSYIIQFIPK
jgi:glycosidase